MKSRVLMSFLSAAVTLIPSAGFGQLNSEVFVANAPASAPQMTAQDALAVLKGSLQAGTLIGPDYPEFKIKMNTESPHKGDVVASLWIYDRVDEVGFWGHTVPDIADSCCRFHYGSSGQTELKVAWKDVTSIVRVSGDVEGEWLTLRGQHGVLLSIILRRLIKLADAKSDIRFSGWAQGLGAVYSDPLGNAIFPAFAPFAGSDPIAKIENAEGSGLVSWDDKILRAIWTLCPNLVDLLSPGQAGSGSGRVYFLLGDCEHRLNCYPPEAVSLNDRIVGYVWGAKSYLYLDLPSGTYTSGADTCILFEGPGSGVQTLGNPITPVYGPKFKDRLSFSLAPGETKYIGIAWLGNHGWGCSHSRSKISLEDEQSASKVIGDHR